MSRDLAVRLRRATSGDAEALWRWRNDPVTRQRSFDQRAVGWDEHVRWFTESLGRADRYLYVVTVREVAGTGAAGEAGMVRIDRSGAEGMVSINIAPEHRNRGVGAAALRALVAQAFGPLGLTRLRAQVKADNLASRLAFARAGFTLAGDGPVLTLVLAARPQALVPGRLRVVATIQARMGSTRLPGKVLRPIAGRPMIGWLVLRLRACQEVDEVVVSTSLTPLDGAVADYAARIDVPCVRAREVDLVERLLRSAEATGADAIVRVTADCPFVDPVVVDGLVRRFRDDPDATDFVTNNDPPTLPHGLDAEVIPTRTLRRLDGELSDPYYREWIPYYVKDHRDRFRITNVSHPVDLTHHRWTVDYPEDLAFADLVFAALAGEGRVFGMHEILDFLAEHPEVAGINAHCAGGRAQPIASEGGDGGR